MDGYILSIDQGTSGSKVFIFNRSGAIVASAYHEVTQYFPREGWVEQDANEIWLKTMAAISEVFRSARILPEDIKAIGISNQRSTSVVWNRRTGEPIGQAIIWQDRRSQTLLDQLSHSDRAEINKRTGLFTVPNLSCSKLQWLLNEDRTVQKAFQSDELLFGTIDSWLIWKLSDASVHVSDLCNASTTGMLNVQSLQYDEWMLDKFHIPAKILPSLVESSGICAYTAPSVFFQVRVPISGCIGDQPAAAFGQACIHKGMIKNTYGTGSFMILNTGEEHFQPKNGVISPLLWTINGKTTYGLEGYSDVSGAVLRWLRDGLGILNDVRDADGLAIQVPDTQGVYFVPAMVGLAGPYFSAGARGTIVGINMATTKNHITRAAVESMAYQTREALECIRKASDIPLNTLRVDGGGSRSDFLMQFLADVLGLPVERPSVIETSAQGAAYMAGLAVGYWQSVDEVAANWDLETRFTPRIHESKRNSLYEGWLEAVDAVKEWAIKKGKRQANDAKVEDAHLSAREAEVVHLFVSGKSMREIANLLCTSIKTVEKQRRDAMRKLGAENLADLVRICIDKGLD